MTEDGLWSNHDKEKGSFLVFRVGNEGVEIRFVSRIILATLIPGIGSSTITSKPQPTAAGVDKKKTILVETILSYYIPATSKRLTAYQTEKVLRKRNQSEDKHRRSR